MDQHETADLLRQARGGSAEALADLYSRVGGKLLALIRLRLGKGLRAHLESTDILQATLLKSFQHIDQFEKSDTGSLMAWLARIAENEIRDQADFFSRKRRDGDLGSALDRAAEVASAGRSPLSDIIFSEEAARLEVALESIEDHYREIIVLRKIEELSFKEIASRLGKTEDACRMLFARAMTALTIEMRGGR